MRRPPDPRLRTLLLAAALALAAWPPILGAAGAAGQTKAAAGSSHVSVEVVQTTQDLSDHMTRLHDLRFGGLAGKGLPAIDVNDQASYQQIEGFGAAMTDTSAWLLHDKLSSQTRSAAMGQLFGTGGIRLNFLRVPMGASDFTKDGRPYSYDDLPGGQTDPALVHFSIAHDLAYIIPALKGALAAGSSVEVLSNPWSPPGWMKTNDALDNRSHNGRLLTTAYQPLANYFVKFIRAYAQHGIRIDVVTPQNEPGTATIYPGMQLDSSDEADLITNHLAPALQSAGLQTKIYGGEVGWARRGQAFAESLATSPAASDLAGFSRHCYGGEPNVMRAFHAQDPSFDQILDECTTGAPVPEPASEMVIAAMRNWASVVATWNVALDPQGGPVQPPNQGCPGCTGLLTVDEHTHGASFNRAYYELGQASAFVRRGARRIASNHFVVYQSSPDRRSWQTPGVDDVAFRNPDGSLVLLAYNSASAPVRFAVQWQNQSFAYTLPAGATATFTWQA